MLGHNDRIKAETNRALTARPAVGVDPGHHIDFAFLPMQLEIEVAVYRIGKRIQYLEKIEG
jgi:hypothetical protein